MAGNKRWTEQEIDVLRSDYGLIDINVLAAKLFRSVDSIHWKASKLKIHFSPDSDIKISLRLSRIELMLEKIFDVLLINTRSSADWTFEDVDKLKRDYLESVNVEEIAVNLNRTTSAVYAQVHKMKLKRGARGKLSIEQELYINENYINTKYSAIATHLGVNRQDVAAYVSRQIQIGRLKRKNKRE